MSDDDATRTSRRAVLRTAGLAGTAAALGSPGVAGRPDGSGPSEVLVGVSAGHDLRGTVAPAVPGSAEVVDHDGTLRYVTVRFPETAADEARRAFLDAVTNRPGVTYAEPNGTLRALLAPNDPQFPNQHVPQQVNADDAWDTTLGDPDVTVAVVDQGVQYDHPDLSANFGTDEGRDFVDGDQDPYPDDLSTETHGTWVAGFVAAGIDNSTCIAGMGESTLLSARALDENGAGSFKDVADATRWAADAGADVINLSLGGPFSSTLRNAVTYAHNQGSLLVAAAGANGPCTDCVNYPAAFPECLAVSTVDSAGSLASFSSTGPEIELTAPGVDVLGLTTTPKGDCSGLRSGTSTSTAVVSGVAGLALAEHAVSNAGLRAHLKNTAVDLGLAADEQGEGRVDAERAVGIAPSGCGSRTRNTTVSDSLTGSGDADCWSRGWDFTNPCEVVVELDGPAGADFDLYVNEGVSGCPTTGSFTHRSITTTSQETVTIRNPSTATDLFVLVDSFDGSGSYTLDVIEKAT